MKQKQAPLPKTEPKNKQPVRSSQYSAAERCQAVLSIWTERRRPAQIHRELQVPVAVVNQWQDRALTGMLKALEPREQRSTTAALSPRLQLMLERREQKAVKRLGLESRLQRIQKNVTAAGKGLKS